MFHPLPMFEPLPRGIRLLKIEQRIQRGKEITGSQYVRDFCASCDCAIRVAVPRLGGATCDTCNGRARRLSGGGYGGPLDEDSGGYAAIARREYEECRDN